MAKTRKIIKEWKKREKKDIADIKIKHKRRTFRVMQEICREIESQYPGVIAHPTDDIVSREGLMLEIDVFNMTNEQDNHLSDRHSEFNKKYRKRLGNRLIGFWQWDKEQSEEYFLDKVKK